VKRLSDAVVLFVGLTARWSSSVVIYCCSLCQIPWIIN